MQTNTNDPPKKKYRSPFFNRLKKKYEGGNTTQEEAEQYGAMHRATNEPRYPDPTGMSGKLAKQGLLDSLVRMMGGGDAPSVTGRPYDQISGELIEPGYFLRDVGGISKGPGNLSGGPHIAIRPFLNDSTTQDILSHEFGHAMDDKFGIGAMVPYVRTKDNYANTAHREHTAQAFANAMSFIRGRPLTDYAAAEDSLPGTDALYKWIQKTRLPELRR